MAQFTIAAHTGADDHEIEAFLDVAWDAWHMGAGHDPDADWSGGTMCLVARDVVGAIVGIGRGRYGAGVGHLSELMVAEPARGSGVGNELVRQFEDFCWNAGCHKLSVHTVQDSAAHEFYRRRGWREEAVFRRDRARQDFVRLCKFSDD